jgi:hypothetical protein
MRRLACKLNRLPPSQWPGLLAAYWWLVRARLHMRHLNGPDWLASRQRPVCARAGARRTIREPDWIRHRVRLIGIASRYPFRWSLCLQSSLALQDWLNQGGVYPDLRIGVRKAGGKFTAHAWLELDGRVLNDRTRVASQFAPINVHPSVIRELLEME